MSKVSKADSDSDISPQPETQIDWTSLSKTIYASSVSVCLGKITTHPLDTIKARLQVQQSQISSQISSQVSSQLSSESHSQSQSGFKTVQSLIRKEGIRGLYQGFPIAVIGSLPAGALYLTCYEVFKPKCESQLSLISQSLLLAHFSAGLLAEAVSCIFWCPVDILKERLQVQNDPYLKKNNLIGYHYTSSWDAIKTISKQEGFLGLYKGYGATLAAFGPQTAVNLALYEYLEKRVGEMWMAQSQQQSQDQQQNLNKDKDNLVQVSTVTDTSGNSESDSKSLPSIEQTESKNSSQPIKASLPFYITFPCATIAGCTACIISTPLDLGKMRMQIVRSNKSNRSIKNLNLNRSIKNSQIESSKTPIFNYRNVFDAMFQIATKEGPQALFKGALFRCLCWVPQTAICLGTFKWLNQ